jgi:hypothetical protein
LYRQEWAEGAALAVLIAGTSGVAAAVAAVPEVGRCSLTIPKPMLIEPTVSALATIIP